MVGGAGFALANVLLAKVLPAEDFGQVSLALALVQLGLSLGTLGLEVTVNRKGLRACPALLKLVVLGASIVGIAVAAGATAMYDLPTGLVTCLAIAGAASAVNRVGAAFLQAKQEFSKSLFLAQVHNYVLLLTVPILLLLDSNSATLVLSVVVCGYLLTAVIGWSEAWSRDERSAFPGVRHLLQDSFAGLGIVVAVQFLWQLERLVIPQTLSLAELGTFSVVAATAGSPFRMIQIGIGHTLLAGLRNCSSPREVGRLLRREGRVVAAAVAGSILVAPVATLLVSEYLLQGRYGISMALILAVVVSGLLKVWQSFASAIVQALGSTGLVFRLTVLSWVGAIAGVGFAIIGARLGLIGIVAGVGVAWLCVSLFATALAVVATRRWAAGPG